MTPYPHPNPKLRRKRYKAVYLRVTEEQHAAIVEWSKGGKIQDACLHTILKAVYSK